MAVSRQLSQRKATSGEQGVFQPEKANETAAAAEMSGDEAVPVFDEDEAAMQRMGKKQQFDRGFRFYSMLAFSIVAQSGWIYCPNNVTYELVDGNSGGAVMMYLINFAAFSSITLSLAEMSSMAPTAGGQYHWASEFAPPSLQKPLSYIAGWLSAIAWACGNAAGLYFEAALIQAVATLLHPSYMSKPWHSYLIVLALAAFVAVVTIIFARLMPRLEGLFVALYGAGFVTVVTTLWVRGAGNRPSAHEVFTKFSNSGGWPSLGLSLLAGQTQLIWLLTGSDGTAHMAEETQRASTHVPRVMWWSFVVNGVLNFVMLVTYCFSHKDLQSIDAGRSGFSFVNVITLVTGSPEFGAGLTCIIIIANGVATFNWTAATARQIFAFARDKGLPFNGILAQVDHRTNTPRNALVASLIFDILLCLISLGSEVAFSALTSLQLFALVFTYSITILCVAWRRIVGLSLPPAAWSLGRAGLPINLIAAVYSLYTIIFIAFPTEIPVTLETLNWSPVMFGGVVALATGYYFAHARFHYKGPIYDVRVAP